MRNRVAAGLFVVAFAIAGVAAGHGNAAGPKADGIRCELTLEGVAPEERRTDVEDPVLAVTKDESGLVKGYLFSQSAVLMAQNVCSEPVQVMWESHREGLRIDGVPFSGSAVSEVPVYDGDPLGARSWQGSSDNKEVKFNKVELDIRLGTDLQHVSAVPQDDGSIDVVYLALKYTPDAKALAPYPDIGVTVQKRCGGGDWTELAKTVSSPDGEFNVTIAPDECTDLELRGFVEDAPDAWGLPVALSL